MTRSGNSSGGPKPVSRDSAAGPARWPLPHTMVTARQPVHTCAHEACRWLATHRAAHLTRRRVTAGYKCPRSPLLGQDQHSRLLRYRGRDGLRVQGTGIAGHTVVPRMSIWGQACVGFCDRSREISRPASHKSEGRAGPRIPARAVAGTEASGVSAKEAGAGGLPDSPSLSPWSPLGGVSATGVSARGGLMSARSRRGSRCPH